MRSSGYVQKNPTIQTSQNAIGKNTCYRGKVPDDAPPPRGKRVVFTVFVDANLYHDLRKSVTGIIHCANQTIIDFFPSCLPLRLLPSVRNTLPGLARNRSRYPFHLPLPQRSHRTRYGYVRTTSPLLTQPPCPIRS
jgi:hypothetical protein